MAALLCSKEREQAFRRRRIGDGKSCARRMAPCSFHEGFQNMARPRSAKRRCRRQLRGATRSQWQWYSKAGFIGEAAAKVNRGGDWLLFHDFFLARSRSIS